MVDIINAAMKRQGTSYPRSCLVILPVLMSAFLRVLTTIMAPNNSHEIMLSETGNDIPERPLCHRSLSLAGPSLTRQRHRAFPGRRMLRARCCSLFLGRFQQLHLSWFSVVSARDMARWTAGPHRCPPQPWFRRHFPVFSPASAISPLRLDVGE